MAEGKHYRSTITSREAVTETILHEIAERHGVAAMGIRPFGVTWRVWNAMTEGTVEGDWSWRTAFGSERGHDIQ
jgi:hypothetical protein